MNLLLLEPHEIGADGVAHLEGRRARHAAIVLRAAPGRRLRIGIVDGPQGSAEVLHSEPESLQLRCELGTAIEAAPSDVLVLAVPRPKVLLRCLEDAAALGFGAILLVRTWRVDKSWLASHTLTAEAWRAALLLGLEQGRRTRLPRVAFFPLFRPFVEDELEALLPPGPRFLAHLEDATPLAECRPGAREPFTLAIGPEGGFVPFEVSSLAARGFRPVTMGAAPQRVPVALAALAAQLQLLRAMAARP